MDRLTWRDKDGVAYPHPRVLKSSLDETMGLMSEHLAAYEETGLKPEEVESLRAEVDRLHKENFWLTKPADAGWIDMAVELPPKEGSYLVCTERGAVCTAHYWERHQRFSGRGLQVTHWMPLPEPVKEGG
ncbi:MAG: DUF551 domain-containing protein [Roseburia sp.]|nr:DUF551 domain-containing protein [Roseburia sp.]